jgi:hypothetical protein
MNGATHAPPPNGEAPAGDAARGFGGYDSSSERIVAQPCDERKALADLKGRAALAGCELNELASGGYLLCRWGLSRELPSLGAVAALLRTMGGAR